MDDKDPEEPVTVPTDVHTPDEARRALEGFRVRAAMDPDHEHVLEVLVKLDPEEEPDAGKPDASATTDEGGA